MTAEGWKIERKDISGNWRGIESLACLKEGMGEGVTIKFVGVQLDELERQEGGKGRDRKVDDHRL